MGGSPKLRIEAACERVGRDEVVRRCVALLTGEDRDVDWIVTLGGVPARRLLATALPPEQAYWLRVWALRGLLWAGPPPATESLRPSLADEHWRAREMVCKVIGRHGIDDLLDEVVTLAEADGNERVRAAARRAVKVIVSEGGQLRRGGRE